jgi:hypothetical protein
VRSIIKKGVEMTQMTQGLKELRVGSGFLVRLNTMKRGRNDADDAGFEGIARGIGVFGALEHYEKGSK